MIPTASYKNLIPFILDVVEPGSTIITDGWRQYGNIAAYGYSHIQRPGKGNLLPRVHRVASLFKRFVLGTFQGSVSNEHLDHYLDEFTFRFNRRSSTYRAWLFYRMVEQAVMTAPVPYKKVIASKTGATAKKPRNGDNR